MPPRPLFAYGTLRDADVLALVLGRRLDPWRLLPAAAPDCRVVLFPGRSYPALVAAPGAKASGTLVEGLAADDLAVLDAFEGEEYSRREIEIIVTGHTRIADVYWPALLIEPQADWRLEDWVGRHKEAFLAAEGLSIAQWRARLSGLASR